MIENGLVIGLTASGMGSAVLYSYSMRILDALRKLGLESRLRVIHGSTKYSKEP